MIQLNLLPDVKIEYIKAKRLRRIIINLSSLVIGISVITTVLMLLFVQVSQKKNISSLTDDITQQISSINAIEDFNKILTIQSQLKELPILHEGKPETSRLFNFLNQVTPATVKINEVKMNFEDDSFSISGSADSLVSINQYIDTLKFSRFTTDSIDDGVPFSDITSELFRTATNASYTVRMTIDETLFSNVENVVLVVPDKITTRSVIGAPVVNNSLFEAPSSQPQQGAQQ